MALDYGKKRTGIAVSDPLQIIATGLATVDSALLRNYLKNYTKEEPVEKIIIGMPLNLDGSDTNNTKPVRDILRLLKKDLPAIAFETVDESYTSKMAAKALVEMGMKKKKRQEKGMLDETAAVLMLQEFMQRQS